MQFLQNIWLCSKSTWFKWICELITKKVCTCNHCFGFNLLATYILPSSYFCYRTLWYIFKEQKSTHLRNFLLDQNQSPIQLSPAGQQKLLYCLQFGDRLGLWSSPKWKYTYLIRFVCSSYFRKIHLEKFRRGRTVNEKQTFPDKAVQSQLQ